MWRRGIALVTTVLAVGAFVLIPARPALAHCDSVAGPVVNAARQALAQNDVKLVLPYIKSTGEAELTAAFDQAQEVRQQGGKAAELAEHWFFETAVRIHRQGEGAAYTGLKYHAEFGAALHAAEEAVETGDLDHVAAVLSKAIQEQLEAKYHAIVETREHAVKAGTVEANRAAVEAVLIFETYVDSLDVAIKGQDHSDQHGAAPAHGAIAIKLNGQPLHATALKEGDKLMLPLRAVAEAVGAALTWNDQEQSATVTKGGLPFTVRPGADGAVLHEGTLMVPAEILLENLGLHHELHGDALLLVHEG
jgi:hypothetical protein